MFEIGHVNEFGDWDSAYGPYAKKEFAEDMLSRLEPIPGMVWEIRRKD